MVTAPGNENVVVDLAKRKEGDACKGEVCSSLGMPVKALFALVLVWKESKALWRSANVYSSLIREVLV